MGIVAGDATEGATALAEAAGLDDPHRLEPGEVGVVGAEFVGFIHGGMPVTGPAEHEQRIGRVTVRAEGELELGLRGAPPRGLHVRPPGAVTALARDVRDQRLGVDCQALAGGSLGRVTGEALAAVGRREHAPDRRDVGRPRPFVVPGGEAQRLPVREVRDAMLQDRGGPGIDHAREGQAVMAGPDGILRNTLVDLVPRRAADVEPTVAIVIAPADAGVLRIGDGLPIQPPRDVPAAGRAQGPGVAGPGIQRELIRMAFRQHARPDVRVGGKSALGRKRPVEAEQADGRRWSVRPRSRCREGDPDRGDRDRRERERHDGPGPARGNRLARGDLGSDVRSSG